MISLSKTGFYASFFSRMSANFWASVPLKMLVDLFNYLSSKSSCSLLIMAVDNGICW